MFAGIIENTGEVVTVNDSSVNKEFVIEPELKNFLVDVKTGDSISINGACMTVEINSGTDFKFTAINETLSKTNLGMLKINEIVNLEKAMKPDMRVHGHFVQGHVDTTGKIKNINDFNGTWEYFIEFSSSFKDNVIYVGSIAVNGISLTIAELYEENDESATIKVAIIPHTYNFTNMKFLKKGDIVNLEFDMIGKYVKRIIQNT